MPNLGRRGTLVILLSSLASGCATIGPRAQGGSGSAPRAGDAAPAATRTYVYVGLAGGQIATFHLDLATGALGRRGAVDVGRSPSALARSAEREVLISVDEATGMAVSLAINAKTGALSPVSRLATGGAQPSGAAVDGTGKYVLTAHPAGGSVSVLAIKPDGTLATIGSFAAGAGAAAVALHPANQVAFVANLRASTVSQYTFNTGTGILTTKAGPPLALPAGSGPMRIACHPSGRWVYLLDEASDAVSVHVFDEDVKALSALSSQIVPTLPEGYSHAKGRPADLAFGRAGRFLYATNRGPDDVATFAVDATGALTLVGHEPTGGRGPGALAVDPSGAYLVVANQASKTLTVFHLDETTGAPGGARTVALPAAPLSVLVAAF